jgi:hypothetical protein
MSETTLPNFLSQAEFARRRGVSKKAVTTWKHKGLLALSEDGKVDVEQTEWNLDQRPATYRGGVAHRPIRTAGNDPKVTRTGSGSHGRPPRNEGKTPAGDSADRSDQTEANTVAVDGPGRGDPGEDLDLSSINLPMAEAVRRKENMLGLLRRHELEVAKSEWVRVEDVGLEVEREYATVRERLLTIPGKIASSLIGATQSEIEGAIRAEITEALNELHDPAGVADRVVVVGSTSGRAPDLAASAGSHPD